MNHQLDHDPVTDPVVRRECAACFAGWSAMLAEFSVDLDLIPERTEELLAQMQRIVAEKTANVSDAIDALDVNMRVFAGPYDWERNGDFDRQAWDD